MLLGSLGPAYGRAAEPSKAQPEAAAPSSETEEEELAEVPETEKKKKQWLGFIGIEPLQELELDQHEELYGRTVDEIRIQGTRRTKDYIILRELRTKVGEPLLKENLRKDYRSLDALDIFTEAKMYPTEEDGRVIVNLELKETFAFLPTVSVRYNDENGFSVGGGLKALNIAGRAIKFNGVALFGGATTFSFFLEDPWIAGNHFGYQIEFSKRDRRNELFEFQEDAYEGYLTLSSYIKERGRIGTRFAWLSIESDVDGKTLSEDKRDDVADLALFIGYDGLDSPLAPSKGVWTELEVRKSGLFGTNSDFWQGQVDVRGYLPFAGRHRLEAFSLTSLRSGTVDEDVAIWQQYGLGGSNTVRGWELGSRIGKNQFLATAEYVYRLVTPKNVTFFSRFSTFFALDVSAFGDVGSAWSADNEFSENVIAGGGVGLRFILPYVGMARIELGVGQEEVGVIFHFAGVSKPIRQRRRIR
jgi:outer membrane protein insertion porin family